MTETERQRISLRNEFSFPKKQRSQNKTRSLTLVNEYFEMWSSYHQKRWIDVKIHIKFYIYIRFFFESNPFVLVFGSSYFVWLLHRYNLTKICFSHQNRTIFNKFITHLPHTIRYSTSYIFSIAFFCHLNADFFIGSITKRSIRKIRTMLTNVQANTLSVFILMRASASEAPIPESEPSNSAITPIRIVLPAASEIAVITGTAKLGKIICLKTVNLEQR